ncbi:MAG: glycosyltransferase 87 family protein, partial [Chloroflexota bacterium]
MRRGSIRIGDRADVAYWGAIGLGLAVLGLLGPIRRRIELIGADDLSRIWAGPRAAIVGADPYDPGTWSATAVALGTQPPDTALYIYPPWVTLALLPLGLLPLDVASVAWMVAGLGAATIGVRALLRAYLPGIAWAHALVALALLLSWVGMLTLIIGQWGYLLVGALCAIVLSLRAGRPVVAGLAALALLAKPQLFVFAVPAFAIHALWPGRDPIAARAARRAVVVATLAAAALVGSAWLVFPQWWPSWPRLIGGSQLRPDSDTIAALVVTLLGSDAIGLAPLAVVALVVLATRFHPRGDAWLAVWLALSAAGAPYTNSYDQILVIVPIVIAAGILHRDAPRAGAAVLVVGALVLLLLTPLLYEVA